MTLQWFFRRGMRLGGFGLGILLSSLCFAQLKTPLSDQPYFLLVACQSAVGSAVDRRNLHQHFEALGYEVIDVACTRYSLFNLANYIDNRGLDRRLGVFYYSGHSFRKQKEHFNLKDILSQQPIDPLDKHLFLETDKGRVDALSVIQRLPENVLLWFDSCRSGSIAGQTEHNAIFSNSGELSIQSPTYGGIFTTSILHSLDHEVEMHPNDQITFRSLFRAIERTPRAFGSDRDFAKGAATVPTVERNRYQDQALDLIAAGKVL